MSRVPKDRRYVEHFHNFRDKVSGVNYYADTMLNKTLSMFKYENLPDSLPERELELILQIEGKGIITEHNGELVALGGSYAPPNDIYYRPTRFIVNNPWANINREYDLETEAVLIRNDPLDRGLLPIIHKFGALLTEVDLTTFIATINMRSAFNITASNDREADSARLFLKQLEEGSLGILLEEDLSNGIKTQPYTSGASNYITQIIELQQYIKGSFYNEIGLNANYNMKRERLTSSETDLNEDCLRPLIDSMLEERQYALDKINEKFGTNIKVKFYSAWEKYNLSDLEIMEIEEKEEVVEEKEEVEENEDIRSDE